MRILGCVLTGATSGVLAAYAGHPITEWEWWAWQAPIWIGIALIVNTHPH